MANALGTRGNDGLNSGDTWEDKFRNKHVDTNLDSREFLSSYRTVIYSKVADNDSVNSMEAITYTSKFRAIGVVTAWNWSESRNVDRVFELGSDIPYLIPGYTMGQLSLNRVMLNGSDVVNALYNGEQESSTKGANTDGINKNVTSIKDITTPLDILFVAFPTNSAGTTKYSKVFKNCQISSRSESVNAGQVIIAEGVQIEYETIVGLTLSNEKPKKDQDKDKDQNNGKGKTLGEVGVKPSI